METWSFVNGRWRTGDLFGAEMRWFALRGDDPESDADLDTLAERFHLHPLAIEDCRSRLTHAPKIDEFDGHIFVVVQAVVPGEDGPRAAELDVFLGSAFLITYSVGPLPEIDDVQKVIEQARPLRPGPDGLFYEILDRIVDAILPQVHEIADKLDSIEDDVLERPKANYNSGEIVRLRARAGQVRRLLIPELALIQRLSRGEFPCVDEANRIYFRDIYDHLQRVDMALDEVREDAEMVLNTWLSNINNRLSEVMKVLSVVAALALPASVISGIFGTNFDNVPGLHSNWGFAVMIAAMASLAGGMALYFRRRGWF